MSSGKYHTMIIKDNFLAADEFKTLQALVLSNEFPWFYSDRVSLPPGKYNFEDDFAKETDGFYHLLYAKDENYHSVFIDYFQDFFDKLTEQFGYTSNSLLRVRLGLKMPKAQRTEKNYNLPHVDYHYPHDTIIFYLNHSDGNTRMFNEYLNTIHEPTSFTVKKEIVPKENKLLLFDGLQYHTASNPITADRRIVLNINLCSQVFK